MSLQYKIQSQTRFQPDGKVGVGVYGIGEKDSNVIFWVSGFALTVGADYFFSRHFGVGVEMLYKNVDYSKETRKINGNDIVSDLNPKLDGESVGFMFTLTVQ